MPLVTTEKPFVPQKQRVALTVSAQNQFTMNSANTGTAQAATGTAGIYLYGPFTLLIRGTFVATISVQRSVDLGVTWDDVTTGASGAPTAITFTAPGIINGVENSRQVLYRVGVKTGNYVSGSPYLELEQ